MRGTKNTIFEKRTGEVVENKGSAPKNEPERTGKRSGEVVENTYLWKKRTGNEPVNSVGYVVENMRGQKSPLSVLRGLCVDAF
ncbi:MAG: hypothetical protein EPN47_02670 [Acidobacteria bacterium]|nr:MAG: hypothetical protein EPN47_02670 [Acidobacteriota bacterium]